MKIRFGYRISLTCDQPTPAILKLDVHPDRAPDLIVAASPRITLGHDTQFVVNSRFSQDTFGNRLRTVLLPAGQVTIDASGLIADPGQPEAMPSPGARTTPAHDLPPEIAQFLLPSRFCESDVLGAFAWKAFGSIQDDASKATAVCDFVHSHLTFGYQHARNTRSAMQAFEERVGVCRDFAHLAVALCRALNIPARYVTGFLGDIGVRADPAPMDFSAWLEVYLGGRWWTLDARHNVPRIGRIVIARGRDAIDVAMISTFGAHQLNFFTVLTEEVSPRDDVVKSDGMAIIREEPRIIGSLGQHAA